MSRLIEKLDEGEYLQPSDDGYVVYWTQKGYLTSSHLREIADELDRRNKAWHEQVMQDVGVPLPKIKPLVWEDDEFGGSDAFSSIITYVITRTEDGDKDRPYIANWCDGWKSFELLSEAKAWCQSEYERRVRECLQ